MNQHQFTGIVMDSDETARPRFGSWIGGRERRSEVARWMPSIDPATGHPWSEIEEGDAELVDIAVRDAHRAFHESWRDMRPADRARLLNTVGRLVRENADRLAELETRDAGKLLAESKSMITASAEWYEYFAGAVTKNVGESVPLREGVIQYSTRVPYGVVGAIVPSNAPLILTAFKLAPALAAGNTVVVKPHEGTTASLIEMMRIIGDVLPPGVLNVVTGPGAVMGPALVDHPLVRVATFTGGVPNGRAVAVGAAKRLIGSVLELGGKNANSVFSDARYPNALNGVLAGLVQATGQSCQCGSRILVERSIHDRFVADLVDRISKLRIGHPNDPDTNIAPLGSAAQLQRILDFVGDAEKQGARIAVGGKRASVPEYPDGFYVEPTLLVGATNDMRICREEIFGPVAAVVPFDDEQEAIAIANDSEYGLVAGLWTSDGYRLHRIADKLEVGTVYVNLYRKITPETPFGGFKNSGLRRENGMEVMREYTQVRSVLIETDDSRIQDPFVMRIGREKAVTNA